MQGDACRLEGFKDPWDATVFRGRACLPDKTLQELGITSGAEVITVRRKLISEGAHGDLLCGFAACNPATEIRGTSGNAAQKDMGGRSALLKCNVLCSRLEDHQGGRGRGG